MEKISPSARQIQLPAVREKAHPPPLSNETKTSSSAVSAKAKIMACTSSSKGIFSDYGLVLVGDDEYSEAAAGRKENYDGSYNLFGDATIGLHDKIKITSTTATTAHRGMHVVTEFHVKVSSNPWPNEDSSCGAPSADQTCVDW